MAAKRKTADKIGTGKTLKILKAIDRGIEKIERAIKPNNDRRAEAAIAKAEKQRQAAEAKRWKPVRRGSRYCSPGCGRGCTVAEHKAAKAAAAKMVKDLGGGWRAEVAENLGWHSKAISKSGRITVTKGSGMNHYLAIIGDGGSSGYWTGSAANPKAAIAAAKAAACESLTKNLARYFDLMPGERIAGFSVNAVNGNGKAAKVRGMHLLK